MSRIAVLGDEPLVQGYALAGAVMLPATSPADVVATWAGLPSDVAVVILTSDAAAVLHDRLDDPGAPLTAVLP
jgi:vacuolar-type H+-ATPase subunit F/Vma7